MAKLENWMRLIIQLRKRKKSLLRLKVFAMEWRGLLIALTLVSKVSSVSRDIEGYFVKQEGYEAQLGKRTKSLECPSENVIETRYRCKVREFL